MNRLLKSNLLLKYFLLFFLITAVIFFSCKKNTAEINAGIQDLTSQVNASVSGFVTDENNAAIYGAQVNFGSASSTTDKYGYFEIKNTKVVENGAVVTVAKPGYFKGIKTFITSEGKFSFCRIKLIPKTFIGSINTSSGGSVSLSNGLKVGLPANAVVNAATNNAYSGIINVSISYIDPTSADLADKMPGNLTGMNSIGTLKSLTSYGMAAVELTGSSGELLQVANGQKATLTIPIPNTSLTNAPATIPLWYFDEIKGYWKEQGTAIKTGNNYVGDVAHFSFWNCDIPGNYVLFNCKILNETDTPVPYTLVKIFNSVTNTSTYGYTDTSGFVSGLVPSNSELELQVLDYSIPCSLIFSQKFSTSGTDISLGNVIVNSNAKSLLANITGNLINCDHQPVVNGYIMMYKYDQYYRYPLDNNGNFNIETFICSGTNQDVSFIGIDTVSQKQSAALPFTLKTGNNLVKDLLACDLSTSTFIKYTINGINYDYSPPMDSLYIYNHGSVFYAYGNYPDYSPSRFVGFSIEGTGINVGSSQNLLDFISSNLPEKISYNAGTRINITEFGKVGEFISGNFSGTLTGVNTRNNYQVNCTFRLKRYPEQ